MAFPTHSPMIFNFSYLFKNYTSNIAERSKINNLQNAIIRYLVPALGGPIPEAKKRRPSSPEEIKAAFLFLDESSSDIWQDALELMNQRMEEMNLSDAQKERSRRVLKDFLNWMAEKNYITLFDINIQKLPIVNPYGYKEAVNPSKTPQALYEEYFRTLESRTEQTDFQNAVVRFFVPALSNYQLLYKSTPATSHEVKKALKYLKDHVSLQEIVESPDIASLTLDALSLSSTQKVRIRKSLKQFVEWGQEQGHLPIPYPSPAAPWDSNYRQSELESRQPKLTQECSRNAKDLCLAYIQKLEEENGDKELDNLKTAIGRYYVPTLNNNAPPKKRLNETDFKERIEQLSQISLQRFFDAPKECNNFLEAGNFVSGKNKRSICSRLRKVVDWGIENDWFQERKQKPLPPDVNFFQKIKYHGEILKPGIERYENAKEVYVLGAKRFPNDYINPKLATQLKDFETWRSENGASVRTCEDENNKVKQLMGWLHRYQSVPLEELEFGQLITKSDLIPKLEDIGIPNLDEIDDEEFEQLISDDKLLTRATNLSYLLDVKANLYATKNIKLINKFLKFMEGTNPASQQRYIAVLIAMAKFLYDDVLGSEAPTQTKINCNRDIPILKMLLDKQKQLMREAQVTPPTIADEDRMIPFEDAIRAMEIRRFLADSYLTRTEDAQYARGYREEPRSNSAIANDLLKFLLLAFPLISGVSRSRTYYDLEIGTTFVEGAFIKGHFYSIGHPRLTKKREEKVGYYICLLPEGYKTGKDEVRQGRLEHKKLWIEIPDYIFPDQNTLYGYIKRWLEWGRNIHGKPAHNGFFRRPANSESLNKDSYRAMIRNLFREQYGVPVPPSMLRKMYSTNFSANNLYDQDLEESINLTLQHGLKIHDEYYDKAKSIQKMRRAIQLNCKFIDEYLSELDIFDFDDY